MSEPREIRQFLGGTIVPGRYLAIGGGLALVKMGLDYLVAAVGFGRPWSPWNYAFPGVVGGLFALDRADRIFYATMLAESMPFIVVGVALTVRRLRDAGWPLWLSACFFAPNPINVAFFSVLAAMPTRRPAAGEPLVDAGDVPARPKAGRRPLALSWAVASVLIPMPLAAGVVYTTTHLLGDYGWGLFVGIPFVLPMLSVVLYGLRHEVTPGQSLAIGWLWLLVTVVGLIGTAFEGLICIVMFLPLAVPIVLFGAILGYFVAGLGSRRPRDLGRVALVLVALLPTMVGAEHAARPEPLEFTCETSVVVDAPPESVWPNVVSFADLDPPDDWAFRTGLAYPVRARIEGTGVGAIRRCEFSTGAFVEPIGVWDEPRLLRFSVTSNPPPMREWNPLFEVHPPHLDGFLVARRGELRLVPLDGGRTLLVGRTLYRHGLWPASYWRAWSDPIIHRIHDRVLRHIKGLSERR